MPFRKENLKRNLNFIFSLLTFIFKSSQNVFIQNPQNSGFCFSSNKTNMLVSGTFNATATSADGKTAVFTNGRFKMPITTNTMQLEKDLHL